LDAVNTLREVCPAMIAEECPARHPSTGSQEVENRDIIKIQVAE